MIMLQCGTPTIIFKDTTVIFTLQEGTITERLSAQITEGDVPADLFKRLEANPHDYIIKAVGADKLDEHKTIRVARKVTVRQNDRTELTRLDCIIFLRQGQRDNVLRRGGTNCVCINTIGRDPDN